MRLTIRGMAGNKKTKTNPLPAPERSPESVPIDREKYMTLGDHLEELRMVLIRSLLVVSVIMGISLFYGEEIHKILAQPYKNVLGAQASFYQIKLMAPFMIYLKSSFMISILLGLPFVLFFLWSFVSPALDPKTDRYGKFLILFSTGLFWFGVWLCWTEAFENLLRIFLINFRPPDIEARLPIDEYYEIFFNIHLIFGLSFQLPVVLILLGSLGIIRASFLLSKWREAIIVLAIASAVLSPGPDLISMLFLFVPLTILFAVSIVLMKLIERE
ncbi:twin-arginine translocase subunit TatC [Leptospira gomenensis]|uniref:Sec-independent protein translocase protein TatC n=2 Tax=Leptospira gomenensis TaxID=2484974 RepID=A0A5F1YE18_9LEPT|nr:twin-arginine translocase subunit TatC [Leptospira gomenensis]TGK33226.1 twin-arginine translocase subunit TatC [Leptospira gomenensis]TGK35542.1 twin-arginine translocase subunit TatC [Leptospira gomenensis]TGK40865.1 twin-arginine translocase subunit TatC [Leptospira gomenensis]TGK61156.1 twin-arginine translocase subunit TatC [Leptospira gomenensis]